MLEKLFAIIVVSVIIVLVASVGLVASVDPPAVAEPPAGPCTAINIEIEDPLFGKFDMPKKKQGIYNYNFRGFVKVSYQCSEGQERKCSLCYYTKFFTSRHPAVQGGVYIPPTNGDPHFSPHEQTDSKDCGSNWIYYTNFVVEWINLPHDYFYDFGHSYTHIQFVVGASKPGVACKDLDEGDYIKATVVRQNLAPP